MLRLFVILLLLPIIGYCQNPVLLTQDYSFLGTDVEILKIRQSRDTLYELDCSIIRPCEPKFTKHFRIISTVKAEDFSIFQLERLDSLLLTTDPFPPTRYSLIVFKNISEQQLGYLNLARNLTRTQLDTVDTRVEILKDKFYFTYYSDSYLQKLSTLKKIRTKDDANDILQSLKDENYKSLVESYLKSKTLDMYGSGITAEILTRACIAKGYDPVGAGFQINNLLK